MKYLIINSHPYSGSFNISAAKALYSAIEEKGHTAKEINLIDDGFDPVMRAADLKVWSKGQPADELVKKYIADIDSADVLVFPFPIWWGSMPAVLKGFCDKVLLPGWAYKYNEKGEMIGLLSDKKAVVITTMETPTEVFENYFNNPVNGAFIKDTLQACGIEVVDYMQIDKISSSGREYTEEKLEEIKSLIK